MQLRKTIKEAKNMVDLHKDYWPKTNQKIQSAPTTASKQKRYPFNQSGNITPNYLNPAV
jgi:hypothetical protein